MSRIVQYQGDSNVYLEINGDWYRYDAGGSSIGEGSMGIVYIGYRVADNERVAVKLLRSEYWTNDILRIRFKQEALIRIDHPNLIRMIGFCEDAAGTGPLYVISEYVSGVDMLEHVGNQLSSLLLSDRDRKIVEEFIPIVEAVGFLHINNILHRDIKPGNIMLQDGYLPKLMDFGVAWAEFFYDAHMKGTVGTVPFAAPEQVVPDDVEAKVDNRSDIYSLGVTLQYMITGSYPSDLNGHDPLLVQAIAIATAYDPENRFQEADLFKDALINYLYSQNKQSGRFRQILMGIVGVLILLIGLISILMFLL